MSWKNEGSCLVSACMTCVHDLRAWQELGRWRAQMHCFPSVWTADGAQLGHGHPAS